MFAHHREFGQWEWIAEVARIAVPTVTSLATSWYQGDVAKDIATINAEATQQAAELQASVKMYEIQRMLDLGQSQAQATTMPSSASIVPSQVAGIPTWGILLAAVAAFVILRK